MDYTPIEIDYALKAFREKIEEENKFSWEQLRVHIYYEYLFAAASRKRKVSYHTFKKEYMPFGFDKDEASKEPVIDDTAFNSIQDYFKKIKGGA